ncbi:hypothetical protein SBA5_180049 [Candidatus Sulfotelmatomonas gaucii]|uniref:Uncharacterized protein n=1 Tax=Candidatus Sulfuritelmatomonas gaucii TaxID=2043161 RepID=A0A2N9L6T7_9BACT|nr:hypothetical protein SBA5_180049 [Candidatus Sulfotelmatomonas gaucii]
MYQGTTSVVPNHIPETKRGFSPCAKNTKLKLRSGPCSQHPCLLVPLFPRSPGPSLPCSLPYPHAAPRVRSSHVSAFNPVSTSTIVMHPSTGHTHQHKLHPTHSVSSTRGIRSSGVGYGPGANASARSLRVTGVSAICALRSASSCAGVRCNSTCPSTGPVTRSK